MATPARLIRDNPADNLPELLEIARAEIAKAVLGHEESIELMLIAAMARGHVLIEGPPGTAKTLLGNAIARILGSKFQRLQCTPDTSPTEIIGVYPLPESQLDRFLVKVDLDYGSAEDELAVLDLPHRGASPDTIGEVFPLLGERAFLVVQDVVDEVTVPDSVRRAIVAIVRHTREQPGVEMGASTRAAIHLAAASKARAAMHGRIVAELEDIVALA